MSTKAKVIFVNSFKGGAGKTTFALTCCIDSLFHTKQYENVVYMDLDVLGTGTCFLFKDGVLTADNCFEKTESAVEVVLKLEKEEKSLYLAYLDPVRKVRSVYGDRRFINHQGLAAEELTEQIRKFIRECTADEPSTLIVLDCAPGFTEIEQAVLQECYTKLGELEVEEDYLTTLDSAHMQKCIQCLNDGMEGIQRHVKDRQIHLVINDVQNYSRYVEDELHESAEKGWKEICDKVLEGLRSDNVTIARWKYSEDIAQQCVFGSESVVENHPEWYLFSEENFKILHVKKKDGE